MLQVLQVNILNPKKENTIDINEITCNSCNSCCSLTDSSGYFLKFNVMLSLSVVNCVSFTPAEVSIFFDAIVASESAYLS